jgi:hypothetical protein
MSKNGSFIADQRGAVALEGPAVFLFLLLGLLVPLADVAVAGFKYISAHQALRAMGQRAQFSPPTDVTSSGSIGTWKSSLPATVDGYTVSAQVWCGNPGTLAPCAADVVGAPPSPKYYRFTTSFTLSPMVLRSVLCGTCNVEYSQPFQ